MDAVIVDIRKNQAAALDASGRIVRIHNAGYEIGQTIELHEVRPVRTPTMLKRLSTGVAAAVLIAMIGAGTAYAMPYGTVTLEGDASIEYTINCFDYVLDVQAVNEVGETLLSEMDTRQLRYHRVEQAISVTVAEIERGEAEMPLRITADTRNEDHSDRLRQELGPMVERSASPSAPEEQTEAALESPAGPDNHSAPREGAPTTEPFSNQKPEDQEGENSSAFSSQEEPGEEPDASRPRGEDEAHPMINRGLGGPAPDTPVTPESAGFPQEEAPPQALPKQ